MKLGERKVLIVEKQADLNTGELCCWKNQGRWMLYIPSCGAGNLTLHTVVENPDGTITVTPSILNKGHHNGEPTEVHGYITNGIWRDA